MTERADVLIIGGGIAGAAAGFFLAPHRKVLLIEREAHYGYHSSGRSAAEWTASHYTGLMRGLVLSGKPFFETPPEGFASVPLYRPRGNILFALPGEESVADDLYREVGPLNPQLEEISASRAVEIVPFLRPEVLGRSFYDPDNAEIEVDALHQGYLRGIRIAGGRTLAGVEFLGAERQGTGWRARIGAETVEVDTIVNAAGAWADVVAGLAGVAPLGLEPRRRTALTFDPGFPTRGVPPVDEIGSGFYFKGDAAALMVSPGDQTPSAPCDAQPEELDLAIAVDRFERYTSLEIRKFQSRWAGLRTFARDELPVAGRAPDEPGFVWLAGQGGFGIMTSPTLGELAALIVRDEPFPARALEWGLSPEQLSPRRIHHA